MKEEHEHIWVRRRDSSWCAECGKARFGIKLNQEERNKLQQIKEDQKMNNLDKIHFKNLLSLLQWEIAEDMKTNGFYEAIPNKGEMIALMHSELSECLEAIRKPKADEHCSEFSNEIIELADCIIRILHYCGRFKLPLNEALFAKIEFNKTREFKHGKNF